MSVMAVVFIVVGCTTFGWLISTVSQWLGRRAAR